MRPHPHPHTRIGWRAGLIALPLTVLLTATTLTQTAQAGPAPLADFDGDGAAHFAVSAPGSATEPIWQIEAAGALSRAANESTVSLTRPGFALTVCDVDNDGYDDLVAGDPDATEQIAGAPVRGGAVTVYLGSSDGLTGGLDYTQQSSGVPGASEDGDAFGFALACGRLNNDAYDDLLVGVPGEALGDIEAAGSVVVFKGSSSGLSTSSVTSLSQSSTGITGTAEEFDAFGSALALADVTGDTYGEIIVGAPGENTETGLVQSVKGTSTGWTATGDTAVSGSVVPSTRSFGMTLVAADFDNGFATDVAVSSLGATNAGLVTVLQGTPSNLSASGAQTINQATSGVPGLDESGDRFGWSLDAGRITTDAYADLLVGVPGEDVGSVVDAGSFMVLKGSSSGLTGAGSQEFNQGSSGIEGIVEAGDEMGTAVALINMNGDSVDDAFVGVPFENLSSVPDAGIVHYLPSNGSGLTVTGSGVDNAEDFNDGVIERDANLGWAIAG